MVQNGIIEIFVIVFNTGKNNFSETLEKEVIKIKL